MFNHNGKNWVILDDFMALKEKLKKTQKEYAKARNQLKEANKALKSLIGGDKNTLYYLEKILPMCEHNKVLHDYLQKIINDFENDLKEIEKWGVK